MPRRGALQGRPEKAQAPVASCILYEPLSDPRSLVQSRQNPLSLELLTLDPTPAFPCRYLRIRRRCCCCRRPARGPTSCRGRCSSSSGPSSGGPAAHRVSGETPSQNELHRGRPAPATVARVMHSALPAADRAQLCCRVLILVIVSRVHFLQKGILNHPKKRWERLTPSTFF